MRKEWTEREVTYMNRWYLRQPAKRTAEVLNRSICSVRKKAAVMGLNHYNSQLNAKTISKCFNCDVSVVIRWINKLDLPARKIYCDNQTRYIIEAEQFWEWAENHRSEINWSKYEIGSILPEPEWARMEKLSYKHPKSRQKISAQEKLLIKNLLRKNMNYKEIAEEIGRSYDSVKHIGKTLYL